MRPCSVVRPSMRRYEMPSFRSAFSMKSSMAVQQLNTTLYMGLCQPVFKTEKLASNLEFKKKPR